MEEDKRRQGLLAGMEKNLSIIAELAGRAADELEDELTKICLVQELLEVMVGMGIGWLQTSAYFNGLYHHEEMEAIYEEFIKNYGLAGLDQESEGEETE